MSSEIEDDEEGATQMMTSRSLVGDVKPDTLDEEEGDLTVPFDRGAAFAQAVARPRPAAGMPAPPRQKPPPAKAPEPIEPDLTTGSITVPVVRGDLPLPKLSEFGDTGEMTVPRGLAPKAPEPRPVPKYDLPPPAYTPPPVPQQGSRPGSVPPPGYMPVPGQAPMPAQRPGSIPPGYIQSSTAPIPGLAQMPTPPPQGPMSVPAPSAPAPSLPSAKMRSPPVFIAVMVACTVLTVTGLLLLVYLKVKHFW